jgi:serine/threonine-protein phosphatase PGAM5
MSMPGSLPRSRPEAPGAAQSRLAARRSANCEPDAGECPDADLSYAGRRLMTRFLYLVRHAEADPHDGPLSETGKEQARLTGQRLSDVPFSAIYHGPLPRAAQTAGLIAAYLPGVPVRACDLAGDYLPADPDPAGLPSSFASFVAGFSAAERTEGPARAAAAVERFARAGDQTGEDYELVVTHNLLIGWLVSQAMNAPQWRWLGLNQMNCAVTIIAYPAGLPASLITFNDAGHLPPALRWTGFPPALRPASA